MTYDRPLYRRAAKAIFGGYTTRFLIGLLCSLSGVLVLFYMPLSSSPGRVGWSARPTEYIPLSEVQRETETTSPSPSPKDAPPSTQQTLPQPEGADGYAKTDGDGSTPPDDPKDDESTTTSIVRSVSALSTQDRVPEIKGGLGAYYLHIQYPPAARQQGIQGRLELRFTVDTTGNARDIEVSESLHPLCDSAAVHALRSVRFAPGTLEGEPVAIRMSLPVRFQLRSDPSMLRSSRLPGSDGE